MIVETVLTGACKGVNKAKNVIKASKQTTKTKPFIGNKEKKIIDEYLSTTEKVPKKRNFSFDMSDIFDTVACIFEAII